MTIKYTSFILYSLIWLGFILFGCSNPESEDEQETDMNGTSEMERPDNVAIDTEGNEIFKFDDGAALEGLGWLIGSWTGKSGNSKQHENWMRLSDEVMQGNSHTVVKGDTSFSETMRIELYGDDVYYTVKVAQNKYPVSFKLISITDDEVQFENLEHDFPNLITYHLDGNKLKAKIEGKGKGEQTSVEFNFVRN